MIITAVSNKKETLQKLFPLESFLTFIDIKPLSWTEVLNTTSSYDSIQNEKFNLDGTIKKEYENNISNNEIRTYWLNRLAYFKNAPSVTNEDFDAISIIEIKENVDSDWLIKNGIESLAFAINNNEKLHVVGDEKKLKSIFSSKQIKETFEIIPHYVWEVTNIDLKNIKVVNEEVVEYDINWINKKNKNCINEIKYFLKQNNDFKEKYRKQIIENNNFFQLLDRNYDWTDNIKLNDIEDLLLEFTTDVLFYALNNNIEDKEQKTKIVKFVTQFIKPTITVKANKKQLEKMEQINKFRYESVSALNNETDIGLFKVKFGNVPDDIAINLWKCITSENYKEILEDIMQNYIYYVNSKEKVLEQKFKYDIYNSNNISFSNALESLMVFDFVIKDYFSNFDSKTKNEVSVFVEILNIIKLSQVVGDQSIDLEKSLCVLSMLTKLNALSELDYETKLQKMALVRFDMRWINLINNTKKWTEAFTLSTDEYSKYLKVPNDDSFKKISFSEYLEFINTMLKSNSTMNAKEILESIYGKDTIRFSDAELKRLSYKIESFVFSDVEGNKDSLPIEKIEETLGYFEKNDTNDLEKVNLNIIFDNILNILKKNLTPKEFADYLNKYTEKLTQKQFRKSIYEKMRDYKNVEIFFEKLNIKIDANLFKLLNNNSSKYHYGEYNEVILEKVEKFFSMKDESFIFENIKNIMNFINSDTADFAYGLDLFHDIVEKKIKKINFKNIKKEDKESIFKTLLLSSNKTNIFQFLFDEYPENTKEILEYLNSEKKGSLLSNVLNVSLAKKIIQMPEFKEEKLNLKQLSSQIIKEFYYSDFKSVTEQIFNNNIDLFLLEISHDSLNSYFNLNERCKNPLYSLKLIKTIDRFIKNDIDEDKLLKSLRILNVILEHHINDEKILLNIGALVTKNQVSKRLKSSFDDIIINMVPIEFNDMLKNNSLEQLIRENSLLSKTTYNTPRSEIKKKKI